MLRVSLPALALTLLACAPAAPPAGADIVSQPADTLPHDGTAVLDRMHARYDGEWYRTLTFIQTTSFPNRPTETWYEAGAIPGKLRIDVAPIENGNAFMYVGDSLVIFQGGQRVRAVKDRNLLMTLAFDVYGQPVATTAAQLREAGVDLSKVYSTMWQGRPAWVVGAEAGDTTSAQFWIDQERLVFVRLLEPQRNPNAPEAPPAIMDVEFNKYERLGGGWIAPEVVIRLNGKEIMREVYRDMKADVTLPGDLYDTQTYRTPGWVDPAP
jgi:hypothetical protein